MQAAVGRKNEATRGKDRQPGGQGFACPEFQEQRNEDNLLRQGKQHLHQVGRPSAENATRAARSQKRHIPSQIVSCQNRTTMLARRSERHPHWFSGQWTLKGGLRRRT